MKRFSWTEYVSALALSLLVGLGAVLSPLSAFSLFYKKGLLLWCLFLGAGTLPLLFWPRRQRALWLCFWALCLLVCFLLRKELFQSLRYVVLELSQKFSDAYAGIAPLDIGTGRNPKPDATAVFILAGLLTELCVHWTVLRRQTLLPSAGLCLASLTLCCLDLSSFSQAGPILLMLAGLLLLSLTQGARRSGADTGRLTALLAPPVALVLGLLCLCNPQAGYVRSPWSDGLEGRVMNTLARLPFLTMENGTLEFSSLGLSAYLKTSAVSLQNVGPKTNTGQPVMEVLSGKNGPLYLRGASLGDYTGSTWQAISGQEREDAGIQLWDSAPLWVLENRSVSIRTGQISGVLYTPYAVSAVSTKDGQTGQLCYDICRKNTDRCSQYTVFYGDTGWNPTGVSGDSLQVLNAMTTYQSTALLDLAAWSGERFSVSSTALKWDTMGSWLQANRDYAAFAQSQYTSLPARTRRGLTAILRQEGLDQVSGHSRGIPDRAAQAFAVADFVRSSAHYDLNTKKMPVGQDFVLWFLNDSDTGYCVHFASAPVALLRALDIPARYVVGYLVEGQQGQWVTVTTDDAHAWAEFYLPGLGWVPLEATPGTATTGFSRNLPVSERPPVTETTPETVPETTLESTAPEIPTTQTEEAPSTETTAPVSSVPEASRDTVTFPESGSSLSGGDSANGTGTPQGPSLLSRIGAVLLRLLPYVLWPLGIGGALYLRRWAILSLRRKRLRSLDENRAAVRLYLRLQKLSRVTGLSLPKELTLLAQRARFSQHYLTRQELHPLYRFQSVLIGELKKRPLLRRLWDQWILVRY